ncbi:MAG: hypothetical protein MUE73_02065 [Planctomycetes bacterium]|nr:hypothetical protein [Planctomycetota bacterium]
MPAGDYRVACSLVLPTLLGKIEGDAAVRIETPPPDLLDRHLTDLSSPEAAVRRRAVRELAWFGRDGTRIVPALLAHHDRAAENERLDVLWTLASFPGELAPHRESFLRILEEPAGRLRAELDLAAHLLAETAPWDERVERALATLPVVPGRTLDGVRVELRRYRLRHGR